MTEKLMEVAYNNKVIILAAGVTVIYYSISTIKVLFNIFDNCKEKCYEASRNVQEMRDYITGTNRCETCNRGFKNNRKNNHFREHMIAHKVERQMHGVI
jgi:uncharacterized protein with PIN domain